MGIIRGGLLWMFIVFFLLALIIQGFFLTVYLSLGYSLIKPEISAIALEMVKKQNSNAAENSSSLENQVSAMIEEKYYQDYDCNFIDCFERTRDPFSLVSKHAQDYWRSKFFSFLPVCLILAAMMFILVEKKLNFLLLSSIL